MEPLEPVALCETHRNEIVLVIRAAAQMVEALGALSASPGFCRDDLRVVCERLDPLRTAFAKAVLGDGPASEVREPVDPIGAALYFANLLEPRSLRPGETCAHPKCSRAVPAGFAAH